MLRIPMTDRTDLAQNLGTTSRAIRHKRCLTQDQLAAESDMDRSFISDIENGKKNISLDTLHRLATALKIEPWVLLRAAYLVS